MSELAQNLASSEAEILDFPEEGKEDVSIGFFGKPIENDAEADAAIAVIRQNEGDIKKWTDYYAEQIRRIENQARLTIDNETARLRDYFDRVPHKTTKTQESYDLPGGKLVWKDQQPEYEREDEKIIVWLKANEREDLIKIKESLDWAGLKKGITTEGEDAFDKETGERIPGITVKERERIFTIGK